MPIRLRIALATAAIMVMALAALGTGTYLTFARALHDEVDTRLRITFNGYSQNPGELRIEQGRLVFRPDPRPFAFTGAYIQVLRSDGEVVGLSDNLGGQTLPVPLAVREKNADLKRAYYDAEVDGRPLRVISGPVFDPNGNLLLFVQIAEPLQPVNESLATLRRNLIAGSFFATVVLALGAWLVGDAAMRPLAKMSTTARTIGRTADLSRRLQPPRTKDEAQQLGETFNEMLARLEETFNAQRRFVADASHELRTPLTALRANADIMLRQIESGGYDQADLIEGLTDVREEVDRMARLVQNLLTLARADVGWRPELEPVDLVEIAGDAARIATPLVRGQQFDVKLPESPLGDAEQIDVLGSADQLRQLLLILLDNAFTYAPAGSVVELSVATIDRRALLTVRDDGPGMQPEQSRRIFERFYRTDDARARSSGGTGLGLAIARWIVAVHDGEITVDSTPNIGTIFTVQLARLPTIRETAESRRRLAGAARSG